jgi:hypothetical protein
VHSVSLRHFFQPEIAGGSKQFVAVALSVFDVLDASTAPQKFSQFRG